VVIERTGCPEALEHWIAPKVRNEQAYSGGRVSAMPVTAVDNVPDLRAMAVHERFDEADDVFAFGTDNVKR
jgi:hypothetical protein